MKKILLSLSIVLAGLQLNAQTTPCSQLFYSQYVDGSGNNKAIEIYNPTPNPISLTGYTHERYSNGSATVTDSSSFSGTIPSFGVWVLVNGQTTTQGTSPACNPALQALANQLDKPYPAPTYANGNDALALKYNGNIIDIFAKIGENPPGGSGWTDINGVIWTKNHTLVRKASVTSGITTNPVTFDPSLEWDSLPINNYTGLEGHNCNCNPLSVKKNYVQNLLIVNNPVKNKIIDIYITNENTTVEIYNVTGQLVFSKKDITSGFQKFSFNQPNGIYYMKSKSNNIVSTQKLIVE
jgi:Lamin Tail Domain/Secretion system C-terminal sorting domain